MTNTPVKPHLLRFGYDTAMKDAFFIAAPLFTAAALSLAGVVAGADKAFLLPGPALLLLVSSALILIAAIQINYYARQYCFTVKDVEERLSHIPGWARKTPNERAQGFAHLQKASYKRYARFARYSAYLFNWGVLLLGLGVSFALAPPPSGEQRPVRWIAGAMVFTATVLEGVWIRFLIRGAPAGEEL